MLKKYSIRVILIITLFCLFQSLNLVFAAVLYNLPVFELEINRDNEIDINDYLIVQPEVVRDIVFTDTENKKIKDIVFDSNSKKIIIKTSNESGIVEMPFEIRTKDNSIKQNLFFRISQSKYIHTFKYKGDKGLKVSVAGEFNGWNMNANYMIENDGIYTTTMELKPGRYNYKFVINGKDWIPDALNPVRSTDGWNNSVITIGTPLDVKYNIFSFDKQKSENGLVLNFKIDIQNAGDIKSKIYFLINNNIIKSVDNFTGGNIDCVVSEEYLKSASASEYDNQIYKLYILIKTGESDYYAKSYFIDSDKKLFNWKDAILYYAFTDRFYNYQNNFDYKVKDENIPDRTNFHGGNFKGITEKIKEGYFRDLGINAIWISPVFENPRDKIFAGYHGYWPVDSYKIAQNFGTLEDLKELVETAHKNNIKILVDYVAKHVFKDNPLFKEHPEYFGKLQLPDGRENIKLFDEFPLTTWFGDYLPAFDFSNPEAVNFLVNNALWLIKETNIDGFRLDAVKHIEHIFFKELRNRIKYEIELPQKKVFYMVGESMTSREKIMDYVKFFEMNGQFDFPLYWDVRKVFGADQGSFNDLNNSLMDSIRVYGTESIISTMLGNHDFSRFMAYADNKYKPDSVNEQEYGWKNDVKVDDPINYNKLKLAFTFLMTIPGIPLIYYGDEYGMTGAHDPDNRRDMRFGNGLTEYEKDVLNYSKKINSIRNKYPVFRYGDVIPVAVENELYVYALSDFEKKAIVVLSRHKSGENITIELPAVLNISSLRNVFTDEKIDVKENKLNINVTPYSALIFIKE